MKSDEKYFIPEITEDELIERENIRKKRRVAGVAAGVSCTTLLVVVSAIGLNINEITDMPIMNNSAYLTFGIAGTLCVLSLKNDIDHLKDLTDRLKKKNKKIREKISKYFAKQEEIRTQRIVEDTQDEAYEQFIAILRTHNDLLNQKLECLEQYKVKTNIDEEIYNHDISTVTELQRQYKNYKSVLKEKKN